MNVEHETEPVQSGNSLVSVTLHFDKYIGMPFWREKMLVINVQKEVHPKLGDAKKQAAITASLEKMDVTREAYDKALIMSERPFYTIADKDPLRGDGEIVIPARVFLSFLNNASQVAPKAVPRIAEKGLTFVGIRFRGAIEAFRTGQTRANAKIFSRFVKNEESNQRMLSESFYIHDFDAHAEITVDPEVIKASDLQKLVSWGGKWCGIGGARPQGYGRFTVTNWDIR